MRRLWLVLVVAALGGGAIVVPRRAPKVERRVEMAASIEEPTRVVQPHESPSEPVETVSLDEFYEGNVTDSEVHLERTDRRRPCVEGRVATDGPFVVQVYDATAPADRPHREPIESVLFKDGSGRFTLWLNPGRYILRIRGRGGAVSPGVSVSLSPGDRREVAFASLATK